MKFALVGLGFISHRHLDAIRHVKGECIIACDPDKDLLDVPTYKDYRDMALDPRWKEVDAVVICTPNDLHVEMAEWAYFEGKKVLIEKPCAISIDDLKKLKGKSDIFVVMQLRHHPMMKKIMSLEPEEVELYVKVKRDEPYWKGWKGEFTRSGGILFNLGVHYLDVALQLLGNEYAITARNTLSRSAEAEIVFPNLRKPFHYLIRIDDTDVGQDRYIKINGEKFRFSDKDNLSMEDLHKKVYEDFVEGKGVKPEELSDLTLLIERLT